MLKNIKDKITKKQILLLCFIAVIIILIITIGIMNGVIIRLKDKPVEIIDTTVNTQQLDKIKEEIKEHETDLINYKKDYENEKERIQNLNDSDAIKLFFDLTSK